MSSITRYWCIFLTLLVYNTESRSINETIARILPEYVKKSFICLVNTNMTFEFPTSRFYGKNGQSWTHPSKARVMPNLYIIELSPEDYLEDILVDLHKNTLFEPRATYLLATEQVEKNSLLNTLEKFYIGDAFAVTPNGATFHFDRKFLKMSPIHKRDIIFQELSKQKLTNTNNVTLNVGFIKKPPFVICPECPTDKGIEIEIFDIVSNYMDVKVEYTQFRTTFWGEKLNGSYTFLFKELFDRKFDVVLGQTFDFDDCHYDFDLTPIHIIDCIQFVVPKAKIIEQFNLFSYVFNRETLLTCAVALALVFLMMCVLNHWKDKLDKVEELVEITFEVSFDMDHIERSAMRCLYAFFMFSIVIFNTGLKSKLFWALTMEHFEYQINSLEDIVHSDLTPVFNNRTGGYFDRDNPIDKFFDTNSPKTCGFEFTCVDLVAFYRNVTTMKLKIALQYFSPRRYVDENGKALIHIINVDVQHFYLRFFFVKGHPAFPRFSRIVTALIENGINGYIGDKLLEGNRKAQAKAEMNYHGISVQTLKIMQLLKVVYIYIGGIVLSLVVFCVECIWH